MDVAGPAGRTRPGAAGFCRQFTHSPARRHGRAHHHPVRPSAHLVALLRHHGDHWRHGRRLYDIRGWTEGWQGSTGKENSEEKDRQDIRAVRETRLLQPVYSRITAATSALFAVSAGSRSAQVFAQKVPPRRGSGACHSLYSLGISGIDVQQADLWLFPRVLQTALLVPDRTGGGGWSRPDLVDHEAQTRRQTRNP